MSLKPLQMFAFKFLIEPQKKRTGILENIEHFCFNDLTHSDNLTRMINSFDVSSNSTKFSHVIMTYKLYTIIDKNIDKYNTSTTNIDGTNNAQEITLRFHCNNIPINDAETVRNRMNAIIDLLGLSKQHRFYCEQGKLRNQRLFPVQAHPRGFVYALTLSQIEFKDRLLAICPPNQYRKAEKSLHTYFGNLCHVQNIEQSEFERDVRFITNNKR